MIGLDEHDAGQFAVRALIRRDRLEQIVLGAYETFGVPIYDRGERSAGGEIGRIQNLAPSMQLIDTGLYWHSDRETPDIIPAAGLAATTFHDALDRHPSAFRCAQT